MLTLLLSPNTLTKLCRKQLHAEWMLGFSDVGRTKVRLVGVPVLIGRRIRP